MSQLNHRFQAGRMNKDLDERLVPNGEYRDALNVQVSTSEGSDVGSLQTVMGNVDISKLDLCEYAQGNQGQECIDDFDFYCVGSIVDGKTDKIYWLVTGYSKTLLMGKDFIAEYNYDTKVTSPVVVDIYSGQLPASNESGRVLCFDRSFLITGINIIDDYLFWTDNNTEPKKVNIGISKTGSTDFNTPTQLYVKNVTGLQNPPYVSAGDLKHEHITVIKKSPQTAPLLEMRNSLRVSNISNSMSTHSLSDFIDPATGSYRTDVFLLTFDSNSDYRVGDKLIVSSSKNNLILQVFSVTLGSSSAPTQVSVKIISWENTLTQEDFDGILDITLAQDEPLFQFKFPRFGYRYKYESGEYSTFSPFSEVAFLPSKFDYMPKEGYNLGMVNSVRYLVVKDFVDSNSIPPDVIAIDILYKESNSPLVYSVKTVDRAARTNPYNEWNAVNESQTAVGASSGSNPDMRNDKTTGFVQIKSEMIHAVLPSNQILRPWDNVPRKARSQEIVGNRIVYGNYLQNYNVDNLVDLKLSSVSQLVLNDSPEQIFTGNVNNYNPAKSVKSLRTYQLGVVFIDEFGRETPVLSSADNTANSVHIEKSNASLATKLTATLLSDIPDWAKAYKFFIKETANEYYNLAMDRWYNAEDGNIWLSFPSSERNKVDIDTFIILKKQHDTNLPITDKARYRILALENEAPLFIKTRREFKGKFADGTPTNSTPGTAFNIGTNSGIGFPLPGGTFMYLDKPEFDNSNISKRLIDEDSNMSEYQFRVVTSAEGASKWYNLRSLDEDAAMVGYYKLIPKTVFGEDMGVTSPDSNPGTAHANRHLDSVVEFVRREVKDRPEFDGRFFAKILKDATISEFIIGVENSSTQYVVLNSIKSQYINPQAFGSPLNPHSGAYSNSSNSNNWYGYDEDFISISNDTTAGEQHPGISNQGRGEDYWDLAGNTPNTNSTSSGWFIDKIEAYRSYKYTAEYFNGTDADLKINPKSGATFGTIYLASGSNFDADPNSNTRMQLHGTDTFINASSSTYLNQTNLQWHAGKVRPNKSIVQSVGIDKAENTIHLSYCGVGLDESQTTAVTTSLSSNVFGYVNWAGVYVEEQAFADAITTPGTIWRWKEDPDKIIYKTVAQPGASSQTSIEWSSNSFDPIDNKTGVSLWNYTSHGDYAFRHNKTYVSTAGSCAGQDVTFKHTAWASQGYTHEYTNLCAGVNWINMSSPGSGWFLGCGVTTCGLAGVEGLSGSLTQILNEQSLLGNPTAGGWGGVAGTSAHYRYPSHLGNHWRSSSKRRRFQIAATTKEQKNSNHGLIPAGLGLGSQGSRYLPTNDPDYAPHLDNKGVLLTNPATGSYPALNLTDPAPGIRPDGMYSGYSLPTGTYLLNDSSGTPVTYTTIPSLRMADDTTNSLATTQTSPAPGTCTWEVLSTYVDDGEEGLYSSTNPGVWETEPKEDVGLEIYHEVGQIYNTVLDPTSVDEILGPIHKNVLLNSRVTCEDSLGNPVLLSTENGPIGMKDEIRVYGVDTRSFPSSGASSFPGNPNVIKVMLTDVNKYLLTDNVNLGMTHPNPGDVLIFTRADGSTTKAQVNGITTDMTLFGATVPFSLTDIPPFAPPNSFNLIGHTTYDIKIIGLENTLSGREVTLPWFNCYSFGNGVESNRIRDDYNQVFIDKGPIASTTSEEPYAEEHRSSGLIYSGIYNSMSGVNNLNQFIQAEKITKDLNPIYGTIQKLYTRDTNLLTFCEDKVFKILANKNALYNADGNSQLIATDRVLGQSVAFAGDYGISKNPESFAVDAYRIYFADKARGSVLRLSQDLTAISDVGMTDWFADNLVTSNSIIGSFDKRKSEYNMSISSYNFDSYEVGIIGFSNYGEDPYMPTNHLVCSLEVAESVSLGDNVTGTGIPPNTIIVGILDMGGGDWHLVLNQPPLPSDVQPLGSYIPYGPCQNMAGAFSETPNMVCPNVQWLTTILSSITDVESTTVSFSENSKGWVSFKSFITDSAVSLNNNYYSFKQGQLWEHHDEFSFSSTTTSDVRRLDVLPMTDLSDEIRVGMVVIGDGISEGTLIKSIAIQPATNTFNVTITSFADVRMGTKITFSAPVNNFYDNQYDSSVQILFNEQSGSVKSFQSLNYEGSKSRITADINNSGEYWDNNNKLGWYVSKMNTDLQEGDIHEFKNKEGKWFSQIKGVATEWVDDGAAGNIDTSEFSYQGIDDAFNIQVGDGGFTSWDCSGGSCNPKYCEDYPMKLPVFMLDINPFPNSILPICVGTYNRLNYVTYQLPDDFWFQTNYTKITPAGLSIPNIDLSQIVVTDYLFAVEDSQGNIVDYLFFGLDNHIRSRIIGSCLPVGWGGGILEPSVYPNITTFLQDEGINWAFASAASSTFGWTTTTYAGVNQYNLRFESIAMLIQLCIDNISSTAFFTGMTYLEFLAAMYQPGVTQASTGLLYPYNFWNTISEQMYSLGDKVIQGGPPTDCVQGGTVCTEISGLDGNYATKSECENDFDSPCSTICINPNTTSTTITNAITNLCEFGGDFSVNVVINTGAASWTVSYEHQSGVTIVDPMVYAWDGTSNIQNSTDFGEWTAKITDSNGCKSTEIFMLECANPECTFDHVLIPITSGGCNNDGAVGVTMQTMASAATSWQIEYFSMSNGIATSIFVDPSVYVNGDYSLLGSLVPGNYMYTVTDDTGCAKDFTFIIDCTVIPSWDCDAQGNCSDPGTGNGFYASLPACQSACITPSWDCVNGNCLDPGTGNGAYASLTACNSACATPVCVSDTYVPDDNFENYLETHQPLYSQSVGPHQLGVWPNTMGDGTLSNNYVCTNKMGTILKASSLSISDLTGIEDFTALTLLDCYNNQLTSLDVSNNTALDELNCNLNQLTSLTVSTTEWRVWCASNQLTSLDVTQNTALMDLQLPNNQLTTLDVTQNTALYTLNCRDNAITSLDVSQNTALGTFSFGISGLNLSNNNLTYLDLRNGIINSDYLLGVHGNPSLMFILVDDPSYSQANWTISSMIANGTPGGGGWNSGARFCSGYSNGLYSGCLSVLP